MIVADVVHPILGMDFFQDGDGKRFVIDPFKRCLTDRVTLETFPAETTFSSVFSVIPFVNPGDAGGSIRKAEHEDNEYAHLWTDFPEVTEPGLGKVVTMTTPLHITTDGPPV